MRLTDRQIRDFWKKVARTTAQECWEWQGALTHRGYGVKNNLCEDGKKHLIHAHRMAWVIFRGPIPEGIMVCHTCDNRKCCNPEHLFLGTAQENMDDKIAKGRHVNPPLVALRFTAEEAETIKALSAAGKSFRTIAKMYDTSHRIVARVVYGEGRYNFNA
jgi:hypothetical protein